MPNLPLVKEIMTTSVATLEQEATLLEAVLLMRRKGLRHLPVVKDDPLVGVLSDRDVTRAAPSLFAKISQDEYNEIFNTTSIERVMTKEPLTARPDTPVRDVVNIMCERKIGAVPVVDGDSAIVGLVTRADLLELLRGLLN